VHVYETSMVSLIMLAAPEYNLLKQYGTAAGNRLVQLQLYQT